jgi:hypothetical protein
LRAGVLARSIAVAAARAGRLAGWVAGGPFIRCTISGIWAGRPVMGHLVRALAAG